jgi:hypothetical protein
VLSYLSRQAGSYGVSWRIIPLVEKTLHRHCAGFEPQRESSFSGLEVSTKQKKRRFERINLQINNLLGI